MAMLRIIVMIGVVALIACGPGPLPTAPAAGDDRSDWFPSDSLRPWPLDEAIRGGLPEDARRLLENGADPNRRWGQSGDSFPLQVLLDPHGAARVEPAATAQWLLEHGAEPNQRWCPWQSRRTRWQPNGCTSSTGSTALMFAAADGQAQIVEALLKVGADPKATDWLGGSALEYATNEIVFEHISRALFPNLVSRDRETLSYLNRNRADKRGGPLQRAFSNAEAYLVPPPPPPVAADDELLGALLHFKAVREMRVTQRVRTLLSAGVDPNEGIWIGYEWRSPLAVALGNRNYVLGRALLQHGANVDQRWCAEEENGCSAATGVTPLMDAARAEDFQAVALLFEFKADPSLKDWAGRSALDYAKTAEVRQLLNR
jgi:ankyrin repeat protein